MLFRSLGIKNSHETQHPMKIWFTSDTHLGHRAVLSHDNRPFSSIEEHDEAIIANHNSIVADSDHVYHLGDVAFRPASLRRYMEEARGIKHLIRGNHDDKLAWKYKGPNPWLTRHEALYLRVDGHRLYLSHYAHRTWRNSHYGSFHLYGHSHGALEKTPWGRSMDVGVMCHNYFPVSLDYIERTLSSRDFANHHPATA